MNEELLFAGAVEQPTAAARRAFLEEACGGDDGLRRRVEQLLAADARACPVLDGIPDALEAERSFAGRFTLLRKLGEGGMGEVWLADQHEPVRRRVALKVVRPDIGSAHLLARFEVERQALALMDHPNIGRVLDAGEAGGRPFFVLEHIEGVPITRYCDERRLTVRERVGLFLSVCEAVQHAHQKGVIHRDLKPSNILVGLYDGKPIPKVIDFGVAKATGPRLSEQAVSTEVGTIVGTLEYMSPEQAELNNPDVDSRSDVYALGVVLYELLTGAVPFPREQLQALPFTEMLRTIKEVEPAKPTPTPRELDWVVMKCLEKERSRRYATANGLALDLGRYLNDEPVLACPPSAGYRAGKFLRRHRGAAAAASLVLLALVGGGVGTTVGMVRAERARATAEMRLDQVEKGIDLLASIFEDVNPEAEEGRPLRAVLGGRLDRAAAALEGEAVGDPLAVARLQDRLGRTYLGLGRPGRAEVLFAKALAAREARLGAEDPLTLTTRCYQARSLRDAGKASESIPLFEQVREAQARVLGESHDDTLSTLDGLAQAHVKVNEPEKAIALLEVVRDARTRRHGADDPATLGTRNNLAAAYLAAGRTQDAIDEHRKVLDALVQNHGAEDYRAVMALNNLAYAYKAGFRMRDALALYLKARDAIVPKVGLEHPATLVVLDNLAQMYRAVGKPADAIALGEQVREKRLMLVGALHPSTLRTLHILALSYEAAGRLDKALPLFQQAAAGLEKHGFEVIDAGEIIANLCRYYETQARYDQAEGWRRKWLAVVRGKEGAGDAVRAKALHGLGANLLRQGKHADAEPLLREYLEIRQGKHPKAWETFVVQAELGAALLGRGEHAAAEAPLVQGCRGMAEWAERLGPSHGAFTRAPLAEALEQLVRLYDRWGKPAEAARWRKELEASRTAAPAPAKP